MLDILECEYCKRPKRDRLTCCGESHWVPAFDWRKEDRKLEGITAAIDSEEPEALEPDTED